MVFIRVLFYRKVSRKLAQTFLFYVPSNYFPLKVWNMWQDLYDWITIKCNEYSFLFQTVLILLGYFLVTLTYKFPFKDLYKVWMYCHLWKLCLRRRVLTKQVEIWTSFRWWITMLLPNIFQRQIFTTLHRSVLTSIEEVNT